MKIQQEPSTAQITYWVSGTSCCDEIWEAAYRRFETPDQEFHKFLKRFKKLGVDQWEKSLQAVELFCGQGTGLATLQELGFQSIEGVDLSPRLLQQYQGTAHLYVGDCRELQFEDSSRDVLIVQGGLHHLPVLPEDLQLTLQEMNRVLRPGGRVVLIEPWLTPFLRFVHYLCEWKILRSIWPRLDALAVMIEQEMTTYEQWLSQPDQILSLIKQYFQTEQQVIAYGKLMYVGRKK